MNKELTKLPQGLIHRPPANPIFNKPNATLSNPLATENPNASKYLQMDNFISTASQAEIANSLLYPNLTVLDGGQNT
ncbi:5117_t:CDS:2 [Funneliformis mosseae]|uniref:5117_t:CDS:1 n=1 Tax=Funneliformis mosseae TaxID=27381 RepID=A0A9N9EPY5_FUNMO|nr:5117_t:CDS:2 [Funneliformis mosseae]